jgi:hypothetical protein
VTTEAIHSALAKAERASMADRCFVVGLVLSSPGLSLEYLRGAVHHLIQRTVRSDGKDLQ